MFLPPDNPAVSRLVTVRVRGELIVHVGVVETLVPEALAHVPVELDKLYSIGNKTITDAVADSVFVVVIVNVYLAVAPAK
jgi:hypothetical protein